MKSSQHILSATDFRLKVIKSCEKADGNFLWGSASEYHADLNRNIFFATKMWGQHSVEFPKGARSTFLPSSGVNYYNFTLSDPSFNEMVQNVSDDYTLEQALTKKGISKIDHLDPPANYDENLLKQEILNCACFISYIITDSFKNNSTFNYKNYASVIKTLVTHDHFTNALALPECDFNSAAIKKGDIVFFSLKDDAHAAAFNTEKGCKHVGIFYGYNENNSPLILDLWNRAGSTSAKVVDFTHCKEYIRSVDDKEYHFCTTYLSLDQLYLEIIEKLGMANTTAVSNYSNSNVLFANKETIDTHKKNENQMTISPTN